MRGLFKSYTNMIVTNVLIIYTCLMLLLSILLIGLLIIVTWPIIIYNKMLKKSLKEYEDLVMCIISILIIIVITYHGDSHIVYMDSPKSLLEEFKDGTLWREAIVHTQGPGPSRMLLGTHSITGGWVDVAPGWTNKPMIKSFEAYDPLNQLMGGYIGSKGANQPFASNIACVLYEMREAGLRGITRYNTTDEISVSTFQFIQKHLKHVNRADAIQTRGVVVITNRLIETLGQA